MSIKSVMALYNRTKKFFVLFIIISLISLMFLLLYPNNFIIAIKQDSLQSNIGIPWNELSDADKSSYKERVLLSLLHPYIQEAVNDYYGEYRQYYDQHIISIKPEGLSNIIEIEVTTFVGAHNPPYGIDTITLQTTGSEVEVIDYSHKED